MESQHVAGSLERWTENSTGGEHVTVTTYNDMRAFADRRRHVLLQELAAIEKFLGIKPTTARIRQWHREFGS